MEEQFEYFELDAFPDRGWEPADPDLAPDPDPDPGYSMVALIRLWERFGGYGFCEVE